MAIGIEHQGSVGGLAQALRTLWEPFDVASRRTPQGLRLALIHEELTELLARAREVEEVHGVEVAEHLRAIVSTLNVSARRHISRGD